LLVYKVRQIFDLAVYIEIVAFQIKDLANC